MQAAELAGVGRRTMYHCFADPIFMEAYRTARRSLFDDMLATIDKAGNIAALALVKELHRAEDAGGGFVLIHCARTIIDRALKSQGVMAVQEEFENLHRLVDALRAGHAPTATAGSGQLAAGSKEAEKPPVPAAERPPECKSMTNLEQVEACRLRMLWMSELGNNLPDIADSLRYNPPQSIAEEQGMLECVRTMQAQEKLEAELLERANAESGPHE